MFEKILRHHTSHALARATLCLCALLAVIGVGGYLYFLQQFDLILRCVNIQAPKGYESLIGKKIVLFSDLHMLDLERDLTRLRKCVRVINDEKADFVFILGDLYASENLESQLPPSRIITRLRELQAKNGIYAVCGNHDWAPGEPGIVVEQMRQVGITVLENQSVVFPGICNICGIQDEVGPAGPDVASAMSQIDPQLPTLALLHRPEYWELFPDKVKLFFAGHTHGGQINIPIIRWLLLKQIHEENFSEHQYDFPGDRHLVISFGIGTSFVRIRVKCPPEILVITFTEREK